MSEPPLQEKPRIRVTHPLGPKSCRVVKQLTVMVIIANDPLNKAGLNKDRSNRGGKNRGEKKKKREEREAQGRGRRPKKEWPEWLW